MGHSPVAARGSNLPTEAPRGGVPAPNWEGALEQLSPQAFAQAGRQGAWLPPTRQPGWVKKLEALNSLNLLPALDLPMQRGGAQALSLERRAGFGGGLPSPCPHPTCPQGELGFQHCRHRCLDVLGGHGEFHPTNPGRDTSDQLHVRRAFLWPGLWNPWEFFPRSLSWNEPGPHEAPGND